MRNISDQVVVKSKTHISCYEIMRKNIVEPCWLQMTVWRMRIALWMPKATNALSGYVIVIVFPRQKCLHERASMLRYSPLPALFHRVYTAKELTTRLQV